MTFVTVPACSEHESWQPVAPEVMRVALAGCGTVGAALLREVSARKAALAERHGLEIVVARVLVRDVTRRRDAPLDQALLTSDIDALLATECDVVVEAIGGIEPALRIASTVLRRGQRLVTANKRLLAARGSVLASLARRHRTTLRYDAAVGGGVPVLRLLDESLGAGGASLVRGILNGTANFVLTRLEAGATAGEALASVRGAGFAEEDATRDLDGRDAADKIALVAWAAFGVPPELLPVRRVSLLPDPARYTALAPRLGLRVRQVAETALTDDGVVAVVEPLLVRPDGALARTLDEGNHIDVHAGWSAPLSASGPGAGGLPTATALLSDLVSTSGSPRRAGRMPVAAQDTRAFRWAIEVRGAPGLLHRAIPACRLVRTDATAQTAWTIIDAASAADVERVRAALTDAGGAPIVVRIDDACPRSHAGDVA